MVSGVSLFRRLFNGLYRRARAAEGAGDYRRAAVLYAEADLPEEAANALLFLAARASTVEERTAALKDALRWLPVESPRRREVEAQIGLSVLDHVRASGIEGSAERRRLEEAAQYLEAAGRPGDAATAYELLGAADAVVRCLQAAGDVDRLEMFLERTGEEEKEQRMLRGHASEYRMAMKYGARDDALRAVREALRTSPTDPDFSAWLRDLEARRPRTNQVSLRVDSMRRVFVASGRALIGRAGAAISVRGLSMSRRHAELTVHPSDGVRLRDLGSKNGTFVAGVALHDSFRIEEITEVSFGSDVAIRIEPREISARIEVTKGIDQGTVFVIGATSPLLIGPASPFSVDFSGGWPRLRADTGAELRLGGELCALPVCLLVGDRIEIAAGSTLVDVEVTG